MLLLTHLLSVTATPTAITLCHHPTSSPLFLDRTESGFRPPEKQAASSPGPQLVIVSCEPAHRGCVVISGGEWLQVGSADPVLVPLSSLFQGSQLRRLRRKTQRGYIALHSVTHRRAIMSRITD